ncbi:MAG: hypothetical protein AB1454_14235 [Candidatus Auribacterota bacterium]
MLRRPFILCLIVAEFIFCAPVLADQNNARVSAGDIKIPHQYGSVNGQHQADNKLIIHIQDNHTNYGAQKNLARILEHLNTQYNINLVCVEGAAGLIDTSEFSRFPDTKTKETVSDYFLKNGKIDGSEYISIIRNSGNENEQLFSLHGIETPALYNANIISYQRAEQGHSQLENLLSAVSNRLEELKDNMYSKKLKQFDSLVSQFLANQDIFLDYCRKLARAADENLVEYANLTNFSILMSLSQMESELDFQKADTERAEILNKLIERLDPEQSEHLFKQELRFKTNTIAPLEYHTLLSGLMNDNGIDTSVYPHFNKFCAYLHAYDSFDNTAILREEEELRSKVYAALISNDKERQIYDIARYITLIQHLAAITISQEEMAALKTVNHESILKSISALMPDLNIDLPIIIAELENYELFYSSASARENDLVRNTFRVMEQNKQDASVLIAGGYHSDGIKKMLAEKNISYVVITPNAAHNEKPIPYFSLLSNYMTPLEQVMAPQVSSLKIASWLATESLADPAVKTALSQKMKLLFTSTLLNSYIQNELQKYPLSLRLALRDHIQETIRSAINTALRTAQYNTFISVESVSFVGNRIIAELVITDPHSKIKETVFVDYTTSADDFDSDSASTGTVLEVVRLIDGSVQEFINYRGYSQYIRKINQIQMSILGLLSTHPYSVEGLLPELEYDMYQLDLTSQDISALLDSLAETGLASRDIHGTYSLANSLVPRYTTYLLVNAHKNNAPISLRPKGLPTDFRLLTDHFNARLNHISIDFSLDLKDIHHALSSVIRILYENIGDDRGSIAVLQMELSKVRNVHVLRSADDKELAVRISPAVSTAPIRVPQRTVTPEQTQVQKEKQTWIAAGQGDTEAIEQLVNQYHALALETARSRHSLSRAWRARYITTGDIDQEGYLALLTSIHTQRTEEELDRILSEFGSFPAFVEEEVRIGIARFYADDTLKSNLHYTGSRLTDLDGTYDDSGKSKENIIMRDLDPLVNDELEDMELRMEREDTEDITLTHQQAFFDGILSNLLSPEQRDMLRVYRNADTHRDGINAVKEAFHIETGDITHQINTLAKANEVFLSYDRFQRYLPFLDKQEQDVFGLFKNGKITAAQLAGAMSVTEEDATLYLKNIVFKFHYFDLLERLRANEDFGFLRAFILPDYTENIPQGLTDEQLKQVFDSLMFEDKFLLFSAYDQGLKPIALSNILPFAEVSIRQRMRIAINMFNKAMVLFQPDKEYDPFEYADTVKTQAYNGTYPFTFKMTAPVSVISAPVTNFESISLEGINDYTFLLNLLPAGAPYLPDNDQLKSFFNQLPPEMRKLAYIFFAKRMTYKEIQDIHPLHMSKINKAFSDIREQMLDFMMGETSSGYFPGLNEYSEKIAVLSDFSFIDNLLAEGAYSPEVNETVFRALSFSDQIILYMRYYQKLPLRGWLNGIERQIAGRFQTLTARIDAAKEHLQQAISLYAQEYDDNPGAFSALLHSKIYAGIDQPPMVFKADIPAEEHSLDPRALRDEIAGITDFSFLLNAIEGGLYRFPLDAEQQAMLGAIFNKELTYNEQVILYLHYHYQMPIARISAVTGWKKTILFVTQKINRLVQQRQAGREQPVSLFEQYRDSITQLSDFNWLAALAPKPDEVDPEMLEPVFRSMSFADQVILYMRVYLNMPNGGGKGVWDTLFTSDNAELPFNETARQRFVDALFLFAQYPDPARLPARLNEHFYTGVPVFPIVFRDDMRADMQTVGKDTIQQEINDLDDFTFMLNSLEGGLYTFPLSDEFQSMLKDLFFNEFTPEEQVQMYLRNKQGATLKSVRSLTGKILTTPYLQNKVTRLVRQRIESGISQQQSTSEYFTEQISGITDFSFLRAVPAVAEKEFTDTTLELAFKLLSYQDQVILFMKHYEKRPVSGGDGVFNLIRIASTGWQKETQNAESRLMETINVIFSKKFDSTDDLMLDVNRQVYKGADPFILLFKDDAIESGTPVSQKRLYEETRELDDYTFLLNLIEGGMYTFPLNDQTQAVLRDIFTKSLNIQDRKILYLRLKKQMPAKEIEALFHTSAELAPYMSLFTDQLRKRLYPQYTVQSLMSEYSEKIAGIGSFEFMTRIPELHELPFDNSVYKRAFYALSLEDQFFLFLKFHENMPLGGKGISNILTTNDTNAKKYVESASANALMALSIAWEDESHDSASIARVMNEMAYRKSKRFPLIFREDTGAAYSSKKEAVSELATLRDFTFLLNVIEPGVFTAPLSVSANKTLDGFFRSLPEDEQVMLYLKFKRGVIHEDIGKLLGISRSVAHKRIERLSAELTGRLLASMASTTPEFTQQEVNSIFLSFSFNVPSSAALLNKYLSGGLSVLPDPAMLNKNAIFAVLVSPSLTPSERFIQSLTVADKLNMAPSQFAALQYIIHNSIPSGDGAEIPVSDSLDMDVFVLDLDSTGMLPNTPEENMNMRKYLFISLFALMDTYTEKNKTLRFVLFSRNYTQHQITGMLGKSLYDTLISHGGSVVDKEAFDWFAMNSQTPNRDIMADIIRTYDISSPQLKLASNNTELLQEAGLAGAVSVSGIKTLAFALFLFSDLAAEQVEDLTVNSDPFNEYTDSHQLGDFTLSGTTIGRKALRLRSASPAIDTSL